MQDVEVIEDPGAAAVALDPLRTRLLTELVEPASAATLATRVGIARQKVNYHLKALESHGLVELAEERKRGGITERVLRATAASYVVSPAALHASAADPDEAPDRLSARYMIALAGRVVREVGHLARRAAATGKRLPTLAIDTEIRFRSAEDRAAFADDLTRAVIELAARYHHDDGRPHRLVVAAHPKPADSRPRPHAGGGQGQPPGRRLPPPDSPDAQTEAADPHPRPHAGGGQGQPPGRQTETPLPHPDSPGRQTAPRESHQPKETP